MTKNRFGINAAALRLLAIGFMLMDHLCYALFPEQRWLNCAGRLAFPIFAFQLCEGYLHTSHFRRYALRLLGFALLSEIPFDLFCTGKVIFPFYQNVIFTLLLALLAIRQADRLRREAGRKKKLLHGLALLLFLAGGELLRTDYGSVGVAMALCFYVFRGFPGSRWLLLAAMAAGNLFALGGRSIALTAAGLTLAFPVQGFALLALPLLWLYNGEKGPGGKALRLVWYAFYPLHLLALYLAAL